MQTGKCECLEYGLMWGLQLSTLIEAHTCKPDHWSRHLKQWQQLETSVVAITIEIKNNWTQWIQGARETAIIRSPLLCGRANWQTNTIVIEQDVIVYVSKWPISCSWYLNYMPPAVTILGVAMPTHIIVLLLGYQPSQWAYYDSASQLYYEYKVWNGPFQECTMTLAADCNVYMWIMHNYAWSRG